MPTEIRRSSRPRGSRRLVVAGLLAILLAALATAVALAQTELGGKLRTGSEVRIPASETVATDLYVFAGTLTVDGPVEGDVVAFGGTVSLNGPVTGDVMAAGGTVRIGGPVTGDVRLTGGQVTIAGSVGEDALVGAGQLEVPAGGSIGEDLILSAGQASVAGSVGGSITGGAGAYSRTGSVGGTDDVVIGETQPQPQGTIDRILDAVQQFVAVLLVGLLALWLAPRVVRAAESTVRERPIEAGAWGFGAMVGVILLVVVIATVAILVAVALALAGLNGLAALGVLVGLVVVLALSRVYALAAGFLADAIVGLALALFVDRAGARSETGERMSPRLIVLLALGVAVVVVVTSLPIVGTLAKLVVVVLGTGALLVTVWRWWRGRATPPRPTQQPVGA